MDVVVFTDGGSVYLINGIVCRSQAEMTRVLGCLLRRKTADQEEQGR
jgi:hypothetical protein